MGHIKKMLMLLFNHEVLFKCFNTGMKMSDPFRFEKFDKLKENLCVLSNRKYFIETPN